MPGIQAEHWKTLAVGDKRDSVRISSTALYGGGLFMLDMKLVPWGCAVWPAGEYACCFIVCCVVLMCFVFVFVRVLVSSLGS